MELSLRRLCCLPRRPGDWHFWDSEETILEGSQRIVESTSSSKIRDIFCLGDSGNQ